MVNKQFSLVAHISTASPAKTEQVIAELVGRSSIQRTGDGFTVTAEMTGESARELNRTLLSALRRVERKTRLRAEWTSGQTTERFFDYVSKGMRKA
jgi:hypothetical protein